MRAKADVGTGGAATIVRSASSSGVIELIRVAAEIQALMESERWRFCFIGGLAVERWGEPRETVDVDLTLLTGFGGEEPYIRTLLDRFEGRIEDAAAFAMENRVLLLRSASGVGIDIALAALPFEESLVGRATRFTFPPDVPLLTCSAEDLIVLKAFASRGKDWVDIEGIVVRQTGKLDWSYVVQQLRPLVELKGDSRILERLEACRREFES
jgi:hypothetical protein